MDPGQHGNENYGNYIHPTAIIHPGAVLGTGNCIGPYCVIAANVEIGHDNHLEAFVSLGAPAEKHNFFDGPGRLKIGNRNRFREFVTVNGGTNGITTIGDDNIFLRGSHVGHDCILHNGITVSCNALIGGESEIFDGVNLGLGAILHQRSCVGAYCFLGMGCIGTKQSKLAPGQIYVGNPARWLKKNLVGLQRNGITDEKLKFEEEIWKKRITP
jgi:UDP-N-acetylglucosamine acyltransferase